MSIIDEQGRLFGRLNIVDAAVALLVLAIVPIGYGAYLLFRDPTPRLTEIVPNVFNQGPNLQTQIHGENLRPYMRVSFGDKQGLSFYFVNPSSAVVPLPDLGPGQYDVVLYDYAQEVSRLPKALWIEAPQLPPLTIVNVAGAFTGLAPEQASKLKKGYQLPEVGAPTATVLEIEPPVQEILRLRAGDSSLSIPVKDQREVPALLSLQCYLQAGDDGIVRCTTGGIPLAPDANIRLSAFNTSVNFRISDVHYADRTDSATLRVRFTLPPGVRPLAAPGDRDLGGRAFPTGAMATLVSVSSAPPLETDAGISQRLDAGVRVQAEETPTGWTYKGRPLKAGAPMTFETARYTMDGLITEVEFQSSK